MFAWQVLTPINFNVQYSGFVIQNSIFLGVVTVHHIIDVSQYCEQ